jgi:hypothetical protein
LKFALHIHKAMCVASAEPIQPGIPASLYSRMQLSISASVRGMRTYLVLSDEHILIFDEKGINCSKGNVLIEKLRRSNTTESVKELAMNLLGDTCIQKL